MLDRVGESATALDLTGVVSLPVWAVAGIAAALVLACALAFVRAGGEGRSLPSGILVLIVVAVGGWWARGPFARPDPQARALPPATRPLSIPARRFNSW